MKNLSKNLLSMITAKALLGLVFTSSTLADDNGEERFWIGPDERVPGDFGDASNWSEGIVPGVDDVAIFNIPDIFLVDFDNNYSNDQLTVTQGDVSFNLDGRTYTLNNDIIVGNIDGDEAELAIANGSVEGREARIGNESGSQGALTVSNADLELSDLHVGYFGNGVLTIEDGGDVVVSNDMGIGLPDNSTGVVTVTGNGSRLRGMWEVAVGLNDGNGTLTITNGGEVVSTQSSSISGNESTATVSGNGSRWESGTLFLVGADGDGELTIEDGGEVVSNSDSGIAWHTNSTGTATVSGSGSRWESGGDFIVGRHGDGALTIADVGEVVSASDAIIGGVEGSTGTATVTGSGSRWESGGGFSVGNSGGGTLVIADGGEVVSELSSSIGRFSSSTGTATVTGEGSRLESRDWLVVGDSGTGTLTIQYGGEVVSELSSLIGVSPDSTGTAMVTGEGSRWESGGRLTVGFRGEGALTIADGGEVISPSGGVAARSLGEGTVTITDPGSVWTSAGNFDLGGQDGSIGGAAEVNVTFGGKLDVHETLHLFAESELTVAGGEVWASEYTLDGQMNFVAGTLGVYGNHIMARDDGIHQSIAGFGPGYTIGSNAHLAIEGTALAVEPILLDPGAELSVGDMMGGEAHMDFIASRGRLNVTQADVNIGLDGQFGRNVTIGSNMVVDVTHQTTIEGPTGDGGELAVMPGGHYRSGTVENFGRIRLMHADDLGGGMDAPPGAAPAAISADELVNHGTLSGHGTVNSVVHNEGLIEIAAERRIDFGGEVTNEGNIALTEGGDVNFAGGLVNENNFSITGGVSDVFGSIENEADGLISLDRILDNEAQATLYGDIANQGTVSVAEGTRMVVHGTVSGDGDFVGNGEISLHGELSPGNSPGHLSFSPDVTMEGGLTTLMELAGLERGETYDAVDFFGQVELDGVLEIILLDGFNPSLGDSFHIIGFNAENLLGSFSDYLFPELSEELAWDTSNLYQSGDISVIPEPRTYALLLGLAVLSLVVIRRRRF